MSLRRHVFSTKRLCPKPSFQSLPSTLARLRNVVRHAATVCKVPLARGLRSTALSVDESLAPLPTLSDGALYRRFLSSTPIATRIHPIISVALVPVRYRRTQGTLSSLNVSLPAQIIRQFRMLTIHMQHTQWLVASHVSPNSGCLRSRTCRRVALHTRAPPPAEGEPRAMAPTPRPPPSAGAVDRPGIVPCSRGRLDARGGSACHRWRPHVGRPQSVLRPRPTRSHAVVGPGLGCGGPWCNVCFWFAPETRAILAELHPQRAPRTQSVSVIPTRWRRHVRSAC